MVDKAVGSDGEDAPPPDSLCAIGAYIDDCGGCSFADLAFEADGTPVMRGGRQATRAELHFDALRDTLAHFGHRSKASREQPPCDGTRGAGC